MEKTDVLVAGAGPAGLYLAGLLEKSGLTVTVLEEHGKIGRPNHCSGLVSRNLDSFVRPRREWIEHGVSGAVIRSGSSSIRLRKSHTAAYVIDRSGFDASLASDLSNISLGTRAENISVGKDGIAVKTNKAAFMAGMLIGCDGANSIVARHFQSRPKQLLMGVIGITGEENHSRDVEIFLDKSRAGDGFFWKIPRGLTTEYGLFSSKADFLELESFFKIKPVERRAGLIPLGPGKTYFERTLLVGDSAGMSKPWSGGGLIYGLTAAKIAATTIVQAFQERDFSEGFLARYESGWKKEIGRQIHVGMFGRGIFEDMDNGDVKIVLKLLKVFNPLINMLDMDFFVKRY